MTRAVAIRGDSDDDGEDGWIEFLVKRSSLVVTFRPRLNRCVNNISINSCGIMNLIRQALRAVAKKLLTRARWSDFISKRRYFWSVRTIQDVWMYVGIWV